MEREQQIETGGAARGSVDRVPPTGAEPSLGELFARLSTDTGELVRQELSLARAEMKQMGATLARDAARMGTALVLALAGALALTTFLVIVLGHLFDSYWVSALVVGVVFLAIGGIMARNATRDIKQRGVTPTQTVNTLRDDALWAKQEAREVKREITR
jgi:uncharacterized membrane protein YqjE